MNVLMRTAARHLPALPPGTLVAGDFSGGDYHFVNARMAADEPVLAGQLRYFRDGQGLEVQCAQDVDLCDLRSRVSMSPGLRITLVLSGRVDVSFGGQRVSLSAGRQQTGPCGMMVGLTRPEVFERSWERGKHERKVSLYMPTEWLAAKGLMDEAADPGVRRFLERNLSLQAWRPSARTVAVAEQMLHMAGNDEPLGQLLMIGRAIEVAHEALSQLTGQGGHAGLHPPQHLRLARLREFLATDEALEMSLDDIARRAGFSISALQRHFRAAYGTTVAEHRREVRLHKARAELEHGMVNVTQAAHTAGYTSAANFATAFKRRFGISPKHLRGRV